MIPTDTEKIAQKLHDILCSCKLPITNMASHSYDNSDLFTISKYVQRMIVESRLDEVNNFPYVMQYTIDRTIELQKELHDG